MAVRDCTKLAPREGLPLILYVASCIAVSDSPNSVTAGVAKVMLCGAAWLIVWRGSSIS